MFHRCFSYPVKVIFLTVLLFLCCFSAFASQNSNFGLSLLAVPSFQGGFGLSTEYVSTPDIGEDFVPFSMAFGSRADFAVAGVNIDGMILNLMSGTGSVIRANENLSVTLYTGPSFIFFWGNGKNGKVQADTGLGLGIAGNVSYMFSNPGLVLRIGVWADYAFLLTSTGPFAFGADVSVGVVY